ncbi:30S ribosomal protein S9 [Candidatus Gracilibacteria bacterium]|nr:30S ribosomal protein S9 [Candidatus Gracilibacteria bacterium]
MASKEYNYAVGRRKETTATIKLFSKGKGEFIVKSANSEKDKTLKEYFGGNHYLYENSIKAFEVLGNNMLTQFDAEISIKGGGISGQADAIKLGFARALIDRNSEFRLSLKPFGLLKRDPRIKERKKPGLKKARKGPTRSKR